MKRREYPKNVLRKKVIKSAFWTTFAFVFLLSVFAIVRVGSATIGDPTSKQTDEQIQEFNREGAQAFAENFAYHYFLWKNTDEGKQDRAERLEPYLALGMDRQAGLSYEGMEWDSQITKSQVWDFENTGEDTVTITLRVLHSLSKQVLPGQEAIDQAKEASQDPPRAKKESGGTHEKYFVVPIKTDGKSFVVYQIPYFIPVPEKPEIFTDTTIDESNRINHSELQSKVQSFLETFFKVYTTGTQEELAYYVKPDYSIPTMNGVLTFSEVSQFVVTRDPQQSQETNPEIESEESSYPSSADQYTVYASVAFIEDQSKVKVIYPYELEIVQEDERWFISDMKNR